MGKEDIRLHLLYLINNFRKENGKPSLHLHIEDSQKAKAHSEHWADRTGNIPHSPEHYRAGAKELVGEAHGWFMEHEHPYQMAERAFEGWKESPRHRDVILNARGHVGIDVAHRHWGIYKKLFMTVRFR
jgi:uncharacterized protein YkwD